MEGLEITEKEIDALVGMIGVGKGEEIGLDGLPFVSQAAVLRDNDREDVVIKIGLIEISAVAERMAEVISPAVEDIIRLAKYAGEDGPVLSSNFRPTIGPEKASINIVLGKLNAEERCNVSVVLLEKFRSPLGKAVVRELFPGCFQ